MLDSVFPLVEKRDKELSFRGTKTKEYLGVATKLKLKEIEALYLLLCLKN